MSLQQLCQRLHPRAWDFIQLMRLDRPIGIYLLLWPTLMAIWIAGAGAPNLKNVVIFTLGTILMRSAGCAINDYADRHFDGHVQRTCERPLATGRIRPREALQLFAILVALSFSLVLCTNIETILIAPGALLLAACYPFMKRYTHLPQVMLGAAYSWGIPMAFCAQTGSVPLIAWLLFLANVLWTVAYDTYYAMADREDDLKIGVKSTAILFGRWDRPIILTLQMLALLCWFAVGHVEGLGGLFYLGLGIAASLFIWEFYRTRHLDRQLCFWAFLHNHRAGLVILMATVLDYALRA